MGIFNLIDINSWPRKFYFEHSYRNAKCTYSFTAAIDITNLLQTCNKHTIKLYPAMIYIISRAVNQVKELRIDINTDSQVGVWDFLSPCYTVFQQNEETFSNIWTTYDVDFATFHSNYIEDIKKYSEVKSFIAKPQQPDNTFPVSCIPWIDFTAFNLNIYNDASYLKPIFTLGKYTRQDNNQVTIPLAIQCHHANCDGYHAGLLVKYIRDLAESSEKWMVIR